MRSLDDGLADLVARLRSDVMDTPEFATYLGCASRRGRDACLDELANAVYAGWSDTLAATRGDAFGLGALVDLLGPTELAAQIGQRLVAAHDDIERVALLIALERTTGLPPRQLPPAAYTHLPGRTDPEVQLLLQRHSNVPFPNEEVAHDVAQRAKSTTASPRVRYSALRVLGAAQPREVIDVARSVQGQLADATLGESIAHSLARCGSACADTIVSFANDSRADVREAADVALANMRRADRAALLSRLAALPQGATEEERANRRRAMRAD